MRADSFRIPFALVEETTAARGEALSGTFFDPAGLFQTGRGKASPLAAVTARLRFASNRQQRHLPALPTVLRAA